MGSASKHFYTELQRLPQVFSLLSSVTPRLCVELVLALETGNWRLATGN
jgi:hypothetical protein